MSDTEKEILIVVATPKTKKEFKSTEEFEAIKKTGVKYDIVYENKDGISKVYNRYFTKEYSEYIVCFIHDDVVIYDSFLKEKLLEAHKEYPIVGLAGSTMISPFVKRGMMSSWYVYGSVGYKTNNNLSGFVAHQLNKEKYVKSDHFGSVPEKVVLIDGLFMSFDMGVCVANGLCMDEDFEFHHYDLAVSLRASHIGLNITTWAIFVVHKSGGAYGSKEWVISHHKFEEKYWNLIDDLKSTEPNNKY